MALHHQGAGRDVLDGPAAPAHNSLGTDRKRAGIAEGANGHVKINGE